MVAKVDVAQAVALHEAGVSTREIAQRFGVQSPAITRALRRGGIRLRDKVCLSPAARQDQLADLVSNGLSFREAAFTMGVGLPHVKRLWGSLCAGLGWQAV